MTLHLINRLVSRIATLCLFVLFAPGVVSFATEPKPLNIPDCQKITGDLAPWRLGLARHPMTMDVNLGQKSRAVRIHKFQGQDHHIFSPDGHPGVKVVVLENGAAGYMSFTETDIKTPGYDRAIFISQLLKINTGIKSPRNYFYGLFYDILKTEYPGTPIVGHIFKSEPYENVALENPLNPAFTQVQSLKAWDGSFQFLEFDSNRRLARKTRFWELPTFYLVRYPASSGAKGWLDLKWALEDPSYREFTGLPQ